MPKLAPNQVPSYRRHKQSGQAIVSLSGRDFLLGPYGSAASRATTAGKPRSSQNARKHGLRSADAERERAEGWAALRRLRLELKAEAEEEEDNARVG